MEIHRWWIWQTQTSQYALRHAEDVYHSKLNILPIDPQTEASVVFAEFD